MKQLGFSSIRT